MPLTSPPPKIDPATVAVVGIDPDVKKPGVAVYVHTVGIVHASSVDRRDLARALRMGHRFGGYPVALVCIEDTRSVGLYLRQRMAANSAAERDKRARDLGRLDMVTEDLIADAKEGGIPVRSCQPPRKLDAEAFARLTGYTARINQEARDAALICLDVDVSRVDFSRLA